MASWLDWFDPRKSGAVLDEAYKNSTLKGGNINRQLQLINRLDSQHDKDRGIKVHTIPRDTRNQLTAINEEIKTDAQARTNLLETTKPKNNNLGTNFLGGSIPNSNQTPNTKDPIKLPEVEKGGSRWVGGNSTWVSGRTGDVIAPNIKDLPKEQIASVYKDDGSGLRTVQEQSKATKQLSKIENNKPNDLSSISISGRGAGRRAFLTPDAAKIQDAAIAKTMEPLKNTIASLPKSEQITKMFDGTKAGFAKGMNTVSAGIQLLAKLTQKKQKQSTAGMEGKGGNIDQVAVVPNTNFDEFGNLVG